MLSACGCLSLAVCPTPSEHFWGRCCLCSAPHDAPGSLSAPLGRPAPTSWVLLLKQGPWLRIVQQTPVQAVHSGEKNPFPHSAATCSRRQHVSSRAMLGERQILISLSSICSNRQCPEGEFTAPYLLQDIACFKSPSLSQWSCLVLCPCWLLWASPASCGFAGALWLSSDPPSAGTTGPSPWCLSTAQGDLANYSLVSGL